MTSIFRTFARITASLAGACLLATTPGEKLNAQPTLRITSPANGTIVHPDETITVTVEETPPGSFQQMIIIPGGPIEFSQVLKGPPWRFSVHVPPSVRPRRYRLTADGVIVPGKGASSRSIDILVERADRLVSLKSDHSMLMFRAVGDLLPLDVSGDFENQTDVDLAESSYIKYASDAPGVATVGPDGLVKATGVGRARITITYRDKSLVVPVTVRAPK
jgi:Bacterial Ig-like domain (group 2)